MFSSNREYFFWKKFFATIWLFFGAMLLMATVIFMNRDNEIKSDKNGSVGSSVQMARVDKPKSEPKPQQKPKPQESKSTPPAPMPSFGSPLSGLDLGLPEFAVGEFSADNGKSLLGDVDKNMVMTDSTVDVPAKATSFPPLEFPKRARQNGISGYVLFNVLINERGDVEQHSILESEPAGVFDDVATTAIMQWKFSPAQYKGRNVKQWAKQRIRFDFQ
jgi:protein TonB